MIAKFWVYHPTYESWIQLRLTDKHTVEEPFVLYSHHSQDGEGFSASEEMYWLEEDGVHSLLVQDSRDCEGKYHNTYEHRCSYDNLESGGSPEEQCEFHGQDDDGWRLMGDIKKPLWVEVSIEQNDYTAQAANY